MNKSKSKKITQGSIYIIVGLIWVMFSIGLFDNNYAITSIGLIIEIIGVVIVVKERLQNKEKLIAPLISAVSILMMLIIYLFIIKSP